jgi:tetratricopeptide (TPR) repeat protein
MREAAAVLERLPRKTSADLYNLACVRAVIAGSRDEKNAEVTRAVKAERERMAAAAMEALKSAVADSSRDWSAIERDPDLDALRGRSDFQALSARLRKSGQAAATKSADSSSLSTQEKLHEQAALVNERARLANENPASIWSRVDLAAGELALGRLLFELQRYGEAEPALRKSLAVYESLARDKPAFARYRADVGLVHVVLAGVLQQSVRLEQADRERTAGLALIEQALRSEPANSELRVDLDTARLDAADQLLRAGLWEEAGPLLDQVYQHDSSRLLASVGTTWSTHAVLRLLSGDAAGYRASCAKLYDRYVMTSGTKFNVYRACVAGPRAVDDLPALAAMAESEVVASSYDNWHLLLAALLFARAGDYRSAQADFDRIPPNFAQAAYIVPGRAVVGYHLGRLADARKLLEQSDRFAEETFRNLLTAPVQAAAFPYAEVYVMFEALRRDAHQEIDGRPAPEVPWQHLFRGRLLARMGRDREAEKSFAKALAAAPQNSSVRAAYVRLLAEQTRSSGSDPRLAGALSLLDRSLAREPNDRDLLQVRGEISASQGHWDKAAADLDRLLASRPGQTPRCQIAACWVAGPLPFERGTPPTARFLEIPPPSGTEPDPFEALPRPDGKGTLTWRPVALDGAGAIDLGAIIQPSDYSSAYVLVRVYAAKALRTALLTACDDQLRLWMNGTLVAREDLHYRETAVAVDLRAGWNTLLARVNNWLQGYMLKLRFTDDASQIARAFGVYVDQNHWNDQTARVLSGLYAVLPPGRAAWEKRAWLDAEVVRRESLFPRVLAARPADSQLWIARGRHLVWLERWGEARAAYENGLRNLADIDDACDEYACLLVLLGDMAAYHDWCAQLARRFDLPATGYVGFLLARGAVMSPGAFDDAALPLRWAERGVTAIPRSPHALNVLGLARVRARRFAEAVQSFEASIRDPHHWIDAANWLGLALAHHHLGHTELAGKWYEKARDWIEQKQRAYADKVTYYLPPITLPDWVETLALRNEVEALVRYDAVFPSDPFAAGAARRSR